MSMKFKEKPNTSAFSLHEFYLLAQIFSAGSPCCSCEGNFLQTLKSLLVCTLHVSILKTKDISKLKTTLVKIMCYSMSDERSQYDKYISHVVTGVNVTGNDRITSL